MSITVQAEMVFKCIDCGKQLHYIEEHVEWAEYTLIRVQSCCCASAAEAATLRAERDEQKQRADILDSACAKALNERDTLRSQLSELYAAINRDGGHAEQEDPDVFAHSIERVAALIRRHEELVESNMEQAEVIEMLRAERDMYAALCELPNKMKIKYCERIELLEITVAAQARQIEAAREMLDLFLKNSREVSEGDCIYCNCEQGGGNEHDCYYDCPMNDVRAWLVANAPTQSETEREA